MPGLLASASSLSRQAVPLSTHARVLIVRMGALGDIIHTLPLLAALRTNRPDVSVDWLADARYSSVLDLVDGLHQRVIVRARSNIVAPDEVRFAGVPGMATALRYLRAQRYEAAIDLQGLIKSAAFARGSGARRVIGFEAPLLREPAARWLYRETVHCPTEAHVVAKNLSVLAAFGLPVADPQFLWRQVPSDAPASVLREPRVARAVGFAVLNPGAAWPNKRWPPALFGALAALLGERLNLASVITWGPSDREDADAVVAASRGHAVLSPPSALHDLLALARHARLFVSGDTGPLHMAASVGAPLVALFGPTRPERNGPWNDADESVSRAATCVCIHKRRCLRGNACIEEIGLEEVYAACARRIGA
jgi:heptosyltransferase I